MQTLLADLRSYAVDLLRQSESPVLLLFDLLGMVILFLPSIAKVITDDAGLARLIGGMILCLGFVIGNFRLYRKLKQGYSEVEFEIRSGSLVALSVSNGEELIWNLNIYLYAVPRGPTHIIIPANQVDVALVSLDETVCMGLSYVTFQPAQTESALPNIGGSAPEVLIEGAGIIALSANESALSSSAQLPTPSYVRILISPIGLRTSELRACLKEQQRQKPGEVKRWYVKRARDGSR